MKVTSKRSFQILEYRCIGSFLEGQLVKVLPLEVCGIFMKLTSRGLYFMKLISRRN